MKTPRSTTARGASITAPRTPHRRAVVRVASQAAEPGSETPVERNLRVLRCVADAGRAISLAEMAELSSLPKGTLHRLGVKLVETGFLTRDIDDRSFTTGPALRELAFATLNNGVVRGLRHEVLSALVSMVGETCNLTTLDGARILYLDRVEAQWPLRLTLEVGSRVPVHCTASGKLFLAMMPPRDAAALIEGLALDALTSRTITSAKALQKECERIREAGFSEDREEFIAGLIALAVPVFDRVGAMRAALALHAPTVRLSLARAREHLPALKAAAGRMRDLL